MTTGQILILCVLSFCLGAASMGTWAIHILRAALKLLRETNEYYEQFNRDNR